MEFLGRISPTRSAAAAVLTSLVLAGCGGSGGDGTPDNGSAIPTGGSTGPVTTRLFYTTDSGSGAEKLHAVDPADSGNPETVSSELVDSQLALPEAVLFATWEGDNGGSLPGLHAPVTVFAETDGHLYRVNALPSAGLSKPEYQRNRTPIA